MPKETDWGKHAAIAAYIAIPVAIILVLVQQIWPPDSAHPLRLDFLFTKVTVPLWPSIIAIIGLMATTAAIIRKLIGKSIELVIEEATETLENSKGTSDAQRKIDDLTSKLLAAQSEIRTLSQKPSTPFPGRGLGTFLALQRANLDLPVAMPSSGGATVSASLDVVKRPFDFDPKREQITLKWPELIGVQIDAYKNETGFGFVLYMMNNSDDYLAQYIIEVAEANAWSVDFQKFLPNRDVKRDTIIKDGNLRPLSRQQKGQWLVRVQADSEQLILGGNQKLEWSNNDPTSVEIWRLTLGVGYYPGAKPPIASGQILKGVSAKFILIRWDLVERTLQMAEWQES